MAMVKATCNECGDIDLTTADLYVRIWYNEPLGEYSFRCPRCHSLTVKQAEHRVIDLLVASGVAMDVWSQPSSLGHGPATADLLASDEPADPPSREDR